MVGQCVSTKITVFKIGCSLSDCLVRVVKSNKNKWSKQVHSEEK